MNLNFMSKVLATCQGISIHLTLQKIICAIAAGHGNAFICGNVALVEIQFGVSWVTIK